jgi:hypothetical protein
MPVITKERSEKTMNAFGLMQFRQTGKLARLGHLQKGLLAALALSILLVSLPPERASAWSPAPVGGSRGSVYVPQILVGDLGWPDGTTKFTLYAAANARPVVGRSPASTGAQIVKAQYHVEAWDGTKWVIIKSSPLLQGQIGASQTSIPFIEPYLQPNLARGYLRFTYTFDWYTTYGAFLGGTFVVSSLAQDHLCVTRIRLCQSYPGYVRTGGYLTGTW